jgi:hypothetical protein
VLSAYKNGTNDGKPAGEDAGKNGFIHRRDESHLKKIKSKIGALISQMDTHQVKKGWKP